MLGKLGLFWKALQLGNELRDAEKWKCGYIDVTKIVLALTILLGIAKSFGMTLEIDSETILQIATGLYALVSWLITLATSKRIGIPSGGVPEQATESIQPPDEPKEGKAVQLVSKATLQQATEALTRDRGRVSNESAGMDTNQKG